ncbi:MAG: transketolase [Firmicutes bacterium]|nr:transketolase [Bacillota bacterium]
MSKSKSKSKDPAELLRQLEPRFGYWDKIGDSVDQLIDIMLNYRQSGHPGGSRSKVHAMVATLLSGIMRWDIREPEKRFGDRLILVGGHTIPLVYATLAVLCEAMRAKYQRTGDSRYLIPEEKALYAADLVGFRRRGGLPGHAEVHNRTLILKFNTGPSGHGISAAVGQALALKRAGAGEVKVFAIEGEGGHTAGVYHEAKNSAWGLGLENLYLILDWNNFGIDNHPVSSVVYGTPEEWFGSYGWRTVGAEDGSDWRSVTRALVEMRFGSNPGGVPSMAWLKTRKGRGYLVYDNKSHGAPHKLNSPTFWETKKPFMEKYRVSFEGYGEPAPSDPEELARQFEANLGVVASVIREDDELVDYIADTLVELGESVSEELSTCTVVFDKNPLADPELYDFKHYPGEMFLPAGTKAANRSGLARWGAWVNAWCRGKYGRPLFLVASADLADSTQIAGFGEAWGGSGSGGGFEGYGWYDREKNLDGVVLPQEITEFVNSGIMAGLATTNFAADPRREFNGFLGACSTYGSFSYLKYGMMRLLSQVAQDSPLKVGKVIWVVGHSGPETADDSRTHFGIFAPGVTQLFPEGRIINIHPWEYNEVPVVLGAALKCAIEYDVPIVAIHLTRPPIQIPDRAALGIPSHLEAAKGAYTMRDFKPGQPKMGTLIVQGTSTTDGVCRILPKLDELGLNVKVVAGISYELFMKQPEAYRNTVLPEEDWRDSMCITNMARRLMYDWIYSKESASYSMSSDWDNRWRTGGTVEEVLDEAHLTEKWLLEGIERFARRER